MFPDEASAVAWFERTIWFDGRCCGHCGCLNTKPVPNAKPMPYWCPDCRKYFSVRTGTPMARSNIKLRKWVIAIYLCLTSLKSVSSMKLHRDIGVSQPAAWFMLHRIREAWALQPQGAFVGPVEADETFVGGREKNKHEARRLHAGRGPVGKMAVVGVKDRATKHVRATVVPDTAGDTLRGFVVAHTADGAMVYTDGDPAYDGLPRHEAVKHSVGEYVRGMAHTNGMESFWSMLKRAHMGTFHKLSPKHLELRPGVCGQAQHAGVRHARADARYRLSAHRPEPALRQPHRGQRASVWCEAGVGVPRAGTARGPASRAWHPQGRVSGQASLHNAASYSIHVGGDHRAAFRCWAIFTR